MKKGLRRPEPAMRWMHWYACITSLMKKGLRPTDGGVLPLQSACITSLMKKGLRPGQHVRGLEFASLHHFPDEEGITTPRRL